MGAAIHAKMVSHSEIHHHPRGGQQCRSSKQGSQQKPKNTLPPSLCGPILGTFFGPKIGTFHKEVQETGAKKRPQNWDRNFRVWVALLSSQVRISWQWHRHLLNNLARSDEVALRINLDETSIALNHDGRKGVVSKSVEKDVVLVNKNLRSEVL